MMFSKLLAGLNSVGSFLTKTETGSPSGHRQFAYVPAIPPCSSMRPLDRHKYRLRDTRWTGCPSRRYRGTR
jgi:hypothetical protein